MTDNELLQRVTDKIVELVPGLMPDIDSLKTGDKIQHKTRGDILVIFEHSPASIDGWFWVSGGEIHIDNIKQNYAPLPRTIRLCDVMRALKKHIKETWDKPDDMFDTPLRKSVFLIGQLIWGWNLEQNDLSLEKKETIEWLAPVLGVE